MADDKVIDSLELRVKANANTAIQNLGKLQNQLRNTAKSLGAVSAAEKRLGSMETTFNRLGRINVGNLEKAVNQIERLSKLSLKNLDGKAINIDLKLNGADKAEREIYATQEAVKKMDVSAFSKKFSEMFNIKGSARRQITGEMQTLLGEIVNGKGNSYFSEAWQNIWRQIEENGSISRSAFDVTVQGMKDEYQSFLDYVKQKPFHVSADAYKSEWSDKTFDQGVGRFFEKAKNSGRQLEADWQELTARFPTLFTADDAAIATEEDQIDTVIAKIKEAQNVVGQRGISLFDERSGTEIQDYFGSQFLETYKEMKERFDSLVNESMKESVYKIPLDVAVDASRIETQIQNAIKQASGRTYDLGVKFAVNTDAMKADISKALGSIDVSSMGTLANNLKAASQSLNDIGTLNTKESGANQFVNSIKRLAEVDLSKFNVVVLKDIIATINQISQMGDVSAGINRLVSSLARLANAGDKTNAVSTALPSLGRSIHEVADGLASSGGLPAELNAFVSAIAQLANAGNRTGATAEQLKGLGSAIKEFIVDLEGAPEVSASVLQITKSLGEIASSGSKAGSATKSIGKSFNDLKNGSDKAETRLRAIGSATQELLNIFAKAGVAIKNGALKIVNSLKQIKSAGNGLNNATLSIKNLIGAMIGFKGITGFASVIKDAITMGGDITEIDHIVESVFGNMSGAVNTWASNAIEKFGIAAGAAKQYAGTLSSMFQASGVGYKDAGKMSMDLVGLAGDLSAFYNIDTETAYEKIRSGMAGMVRPLRDLGIDLTAATLEEYRLAQGIQTSYSAMSQAEKVMLRYQYLMEVTNLQQGDFSRTSGRILRAA